MGQGVGRLFLGNDTVRDLMTSAATLTILKWGAIVGCIAGIVSRTSRGFDLLILLIVLILDATTKSIGGFVNHAQSAPLFVLGILALAPRPPLLSVRSLIGDYSGARHHLSQGASDSAACEAATGLVAVALLIPYSFIGLNRLVVDGPRMFSSDAILYYFAGASRSFESYPGWWPIAIVMRIAPFMFLLTTLAEASSPLVLVSRRYRKWWLVFMVCFHASTVLLMNILFWENLMLLTIVFCKSADDSRESNSTLI